MSLNYVTGAPGSGKTTLQEELSARGYDARDIDNSDLGGPHNKSTGMLVTIPPADQRSPEWFEAHKWRIYPDAFEGLKSEAAHADIIICGVAASDDEILHVFDKIMYLDIDDAALSHRLQIREGNDYGKNEFELLEILDRKHRLDQKYSSLDVVHLDATRPVKEVVDDVISHI
jgi:gluconate kinase